MDMKFLPVPNAGKAMDWAPFLSASVNSSFIRAGQSALLLGLIKWNIILHLSFPDLVFTTFDCRPFLTEIEYISTISHTVIAKHVQYITDDIFPQTLYTYSTNIYLQSCLRVGLRYLFIAFPRFAKRVFI